MSYETLNNISTTEKNAPLKGPRISLKFIIDRVKHWLAKSSNSPNLSVSCRVSYEFNTSPETGPNQQTVILHTPIVILV